MIDMEKDNNDNENDNKECNENNNEEHSNEMCHQLQQVNEKMELACNFEMIQARV